MHSLKDILHDIFWAGFEFWCGCGLLAGIGATGATLYGAWVVVADVLRRPAPKDTEAHHAERL